MKKPVILFVLQIIWLVSVLYKFLVKGISDQNCEMKFLKYLTNIAIVSEAFCEYQFTSSNIRSKLLISNYYAVRRSSYFLCECSFLIN